MTAHLTPKKVVDKNGRHTTVYVKPPQNASSRLGKVSKPPVTKPVDVDSGLRVNDIMRKRADLHRSIYTDHSNGVAFDSLMESINERNRLEGVIRDWKNPSRDDGSPTVDTHIQLPSPFLEGQKRYGFSNDLLTKDEPRDSLIKISAEVSDVWLDALSSAEAIAVSEYAGDSQRYAVESASGELSPIWQDFESAVARGPVMEPFVVYTGVNGHYVGGIIDQVDSGEVVLNRVFSSSFNPGQVNGFATGMDMYDGNKVKESNGLTLALEVETNTGSFMENISHAQHELEVMLPKGKYEVLEVLENIKYLWGTKREEEVGRVIDKTVRLRYLGE